MRLTSVATALTAMWLASAAGAATNSFIAPAFRGLAESEFAGWERFAVAAGAPGNPPDRATFPSANGDGVLTQTDPGAFLTGSSNIYNLGGISAFVFDDATPFSLSRVVLQIRTVGEELDYASVRLSYDAGAGPVSAAAPRVELDRGVSMGATVSSLWQWDLPEDGVTSYQIEFRAAGSSLSLDAITVDTASAAAASAVPEPGAGSLLLAGAVAAGLAARFRARPG